MAGMSSRTLDAFETLSKVLLAAAFIVLVLGAVGSISVSAAPAESLPGFENVEREGRGLAALGAFAAGLTAAGILAGLGGILRLQVEASRSR
jgi:hypothetical protein